MIILNNAATLTLDLTQNSTRTREDALKSVENFLKSIILQYKSLKLISDNETFTIEVPKSMPIKEMVGYSEEIFEKTSDFVKRENMEFILPVLNINLKRS